jgi:hypothetical protein
MSWIRLRTIGLLALGAAVLGQPALAPAIGQSPGVQTLPNRPQPSKNLPADFIDSRPILAYFDDKPMPDSVRGLLEELKRPDRCGRGAKVAPEEACALVFYKLDSAFTPDTLRPPFIIKAIYRVTTPENPADTVMTMPDAKGDLTRYYGGDLYEPLRPIRANICRVDKRHTDQCTPTGSKGVLYHAYGILGKAENAREDLLPAKSAHKHFFLGLRPVDEEWLKEQQRQDLCHQKTFKGEYLMSC